PRPAPTLTLFPYTTLFRSEPVVNADRAAGGVFGIAAVGQDARRALHVPARPGAEQHGDGRVVAQGPVFAGAEGDAGVEVAVVLRSVEHTSELQSRFELVCR